MNLLVDHIVQIVDDPKQAGCQLKRLNFDVVEHVTEAPETSYVRSTCDNTYLEYRGRRCTSSQTFRLINKSRERNGDVGGQTTGTWIAFQVENLECLAQRLTGEGFRVFCLSEPATLMTEGVQKESRVLFPRMKTKSMMPLPVFVERGEASHHVQPASLAWLPRHSEGLRLCNIVIAVRDLPFVIETWARILQRRPTESWIQADLNAYCARIPLDDDIYLIFCTPTGDGVVQDVLTKHGERPFLLNFTGSNRQGDSAVCGTVYRLT
jgi:hypothetical protein